MSQPQDGPRRLKQKRRRAKKEAELTLRKLETKKPAEKKA